MQKERTMIIKADLHIHSCLSPCGSLEMSPKRIVEELKAKQIQLAALTDHNSSLNCPSFAKLCKKAGIAALFGLEVQTLEEIHVLALFNDLEKSLEFSAFLYNLLPNVQNIPEKMGDQVFVDEKDQILGEVDKYLLNSIPLTIDELSSEIHTRGGIVIPAHVDRPSFSLTSQFGYITEGEWDALEIVGFKKNPPLDTKNYPKIFSSDAHFPSQISERHSLLEVPENFFKTEKIDLAILKKAFQTSVFQNVQ